MPNRRANQPDDHAGSHSCGHQKGSRADPGELLVMSLLLVGSMAIDAVETPFGKRDDALGGSATFFSTAASLLTDVRLVAVIGDDFPPEHIEMLKKRDIDLSGVERVKGGKTF